MHSLDRRCALAACLLVLLAGCSRSPPNPDDVVTVPPGDSERAPVYHDERTGDLTRRGRSGPSLADVEQHPASTSVQQLLQSLARGRLDHVYDFLPASYQADVDQLVREWATQTDPELWSVIVRTTQKGSRVLHDQQAFLTESLNLGGQPALLDALATDWQRMSTAVAEFDGRNLESLDYWRQFDSRKFLETRGNDLFRRLRGDGPAARELADRLQEIHMLALNSTETRAVLQIWVPGADEAQIVEFVVVEDRWLPRPLVDAWPNFIAGLQRRIAPGTVEQQRAMTTQWLEVEQGFDHMLAAETSEQFRSAAAPVLLRALQLARRWQQPPGPPDGISLTIRTPLDDTQQTRILHELEQLTDDPEHCVYTATATADAMVISLRPVSDVERFAARLPFAHELEIDAPGRAIAFRYQQP